MLPCDVRAAVRELRGDCVHMTALSWGCRCLWRASWGGRWVDAGALEERLSRERGTMRGMLLGEGRDGERGEGRTFRPGGHSTHAPAPSLPAVR